MKIEIFVILEENFTKILEKIYPDFLKLSNTSRLLCILNLKLFDNYDTNVQNYFTNKCISYVKEIMVNI